MYFQNYLCNAHNTKFCMKINNWAWIDLMHFSIQERRPLEATWILYHSLISHLSVQFSPWGTTWLEQLHYVLLMPTIYLFSLGFVIIVRPTWWGCSPALAGRWSSWLPSRQSGCCPSPPQASGLSCQGRRQCHMDCTMHMDSKSFWDPTCSALCLICGTRAWTFHQS